VGNEDRFVDGGIVGDEPASAVQVEERVVLRARGRGLAEKQLLVVFVRRLVRVVVSEIRVAG